MRECGRGQRVKFQRQEEAKIPNIFPQNQGYQINFYVFTGIRTQKTFKLDNNKHVPNRVANIMDFSVEVRNSEKIRISPDFYMEFRNFRILYGY